MQLRRLVSATAVVTCSFALFGCAERSTPTPPPPVASAVSAAASPTGPAPASPSTPAGSPSPAPTKAAAAVLTAKGIGKYVVGTKMTTLKASGLVMNEKPTMGCADWVIAQGTGDYANIGLVFYKGAILWINVDKNAPATAAGIKVGATYDAVVAAYPSALKLNDGLGGKAISAHDGDNALFFRFDPGNKTLMRIEAGKAETLDFRFQEGEGC